MASRRTKGKVMLRWSERAFTTTELIVVMMIIGILAALATPPLSRWLATIGVDAAARNIASELQFGKMKAISENTNVRINFDPANDTYQVQKAAGGGWQDVGGAKALPAGVDLVSATTDPIFQPLGTAPGGTTVTLRNAQGRTRRVKVSFIGRVKIE